MKAYKIELLIIDHDNVGEEEIRGIIGNVRYLYPLIKSVEVRDIGDWSDEHPLTQRDTADAEYRALFPRGTE